MIVSDGKDCTYYILLKLLENELFMHWAWIFEENYEIKYHKQKNHFANI